MGKVWLLGLDGATFHILQPMIDDGKLPVIAGLIERGASAVLKSNVAPVTPQAWASVLTGNNPGKHGVFGFVRQIPGRPPEFLSSKSMKGDKLWTWFSRAGLTSMIMNVPLTYPPEPLNGVMITGMMTPSTQSEFTYPPDLKARVLSDFPDHKLDIRGGIGYSRNFDILSELESALTAQVDLMKVLINERDPDLLFAVFILPDRIQHTYSQYINPESTIYHSRAANERRPRLWAAYAKLDAALGELLEEAPAGTNVMLISDHGFTMERGAFYTNVFLAHLRLLSLKSGSGRGVARSLIRRLNFPAFKRFLPPKAFEMTLSLTKEAIDWSKTLAYASPVAQQGIYINLADRGPEGIVERGDYEPLRDRIISAVADVKDKAGRSVMTAHRREELFFGPYLESLPDIVFSFEDQGIEAKEVVLGGEFLAFTDGGSRGRHARDGIFIAAGPQVRPGQYSELTLEDIAPNVLALSGAVDIPPDIDGRLRADIFETGRAEVKVTE